MKILIALPLLVLAACQVSKDEANDTISAEFNQDVAEEGLADAANTAENIAGIVANDVEQAADKVEQKAENTDIDVDIDTDGNKAN